VESEHAFDSVEHGVVLPAACHEPDDRGLLRLVEGREQHLVGPLGVLLRGDVIRRLEVERAHFAGIDKLDDIDGPGTRLLELMELLVFEDDVAAIDGIAADELVALNGAIAARTKPLLSSCARPSIRSASVRPGVAS
jgi:hypothetical protein